jgi:peptidoglycan/LPS O-acetylase OafA/YrhL
MASIRGIAALVVVLTHAFQIFCLPYFGLYGFPHLFTSFLAAYAVVFFFIVSGFMIFISVENHTQADAKFNLAAFFKARFLRIYPPLVLSLVLVVAIYYLMVFFGIHGAESFRLSGDLFVSRERVGLEWDRMLPTLLLLYNIVPDVTPPLSLNGPLWTLSYEWWFYLFIMFAVNARRNKTILAGYLPLILVMVLFRYAPSGYLCRVLLMIWLGGFFLGYLYSKGMLFHARFPWIALIFSIACLGAMGLAGGKDTIAYFIEPLQRYGNAAHLQVMFPAFILTAMLGLLIRLGINPKVLLSSADYSYTLYVIHFPLQILAFGLLHPSLHSWSWGISFVAGIVVTVVIIQIASRLAKMVENKVLLKSVMQRLIR